jgi:hypothetical protein
MSIGDLVADRDGQMGIVLTEPRLCKDPDMHGDEYWLVDVQMPWCVECMATDEIEILSHAE